MPRAVAPALHLSPPLDAVPARVDGVDPRAHTHTPLQSFIVSQIDGRRSITELSAAIGVPSSSIASLVARLVDERALRLAGSTVDSSAPTRRQSETRLVAERDSQRPTLPGTADHLLAHERPTRPMPK